MPRCRSACLLPYKWFQVRNLATKLPSSVPRASKAGRSRKEARQGSCSSEASRCSQNRSRRAQLTVADHRPVSVSKPTGSTRKLLVVRGMIRTCTIHLRSRWETSYLREEVLRDAVTHFRVKNEKSVGVHRPFQYILGTGIIGMRRRSEGEFTANIDLVRSHPFWDSIFPATGDAVLKAQRAGDGVPSSKHAKDILLYIF